jgi:hypothetical protein
MEDCKFEFGSDSDIHNVNELLSEKNDRRDEHGRLGNLIFRLKK